MAKKKSWFSLVKRLFVSESQSTQEKKERRRRWVFGGYKIRRLPSLTAPPQKRLSEAEEEQNKHALNVVSATAEAAAEVEKLTGIPESIHQVHAGEEESSPTSPIHHSHHLSHEQEWKIQQLAATKIQTAYRGYLARKALRALKGIVKLQALIRGRAVRRQAVTTLKCLQSIVNIQTQACARRYQTVEGTDENKEWQVLGDKIIKVDSCSERRWDDSLLSKQNADALILSKKEAALKRERIKEYSFHHRKSAESERKKVNGRLRYWLEQWMDTQVSKSKELEDLDTMFNSTRTAEEFGGRKQLKLRSFQRKNPTEAMDSPVLASRRSSSHHRRQGSTGEDNAFSSSPLVVPTYMAATQSARAKARSVSSPKQRPGISETCSECYSPYKNKLSLVSSVISETPSNARTIRHGGGGHNQQRSPSLKAVPGIIKSSSRTAKDLSFDSECSFSNLDRQFR